MGFGVDELSLCCFPLMPPKKQRRLAQQTTANGNLNLKNRVLPLAIETTVYSMLSLVDLGSLFLASRFLSTQVIRYLGELRVLHWLQADHYLEKRNGRSVQDIRFALDLVVGHCRGLRFVDIPHKPLLEICNFNDVKSQSIPISSSVLLTSDRINERWMLTLIERNIPTLESVCSFPLPLTASAALSRCVQMRFIDLTHFKNNTSDDDGDNIPLETASALALRMVTPQHFPHLDSLCAVVVVEDHSTIITDEFAVSEKALCVLLTRGKTRYLYIYIYQLLFSFHSSHLLNTKKESCFYN
jgi:hypothetical protein